MCKVGRGTFQVTTTEYWCVITSGLTKEGEAAAEEAVPTSAAFKIFAVRKKSFPNWVWKKIFGQGFSWVPTIGN